MNDQDFNKIINAPPPSVRLLADQYRNTHMGTDQVQIQVDDLRRQLKRAEDQLERQKGGLTSLRQAVVLQLQFDQEQEQASLKAKHELEQKLKRQNGVEHGTR